MIKRRNKIIIITACVGLLYSLCAYYNWRYQKTSRELQNIQSQVESVQNKLATSQKNLQVEMEKSYGLSQALGNMSKELRDANTTIEDLKSNEYELVYMGDFKITYYCDLPYEHICGYGHQTTASGKPTEVGWTVAADWSVLPNGSIIYIDGLGFREVMDVGGAVNGSHIDVLVDTHEYAIDLGMDYKDVWILIKKS